MTFEEFRAVVKKIASEEFLPPELSLCGPFHPETIKEMKRLDLACPYCLKKARKHS